MNIKYLLFSLFLLGFIACKTSTQLADVSEGKYQVGLDNSISEDEEILALIEPFKEQLDVEMDVQINTLDVTLTKERGQCTMGNWMTDILYDFSIKNTDKHVHASIQNYGGMRTKSIQEGPLTIRNIFELMPFENEVVLVEIPGDVVFQLFERIANYGGWPVSRQVKMVSKDKKLESLLLEGKEVDRNKTYNIILPDYVANGGDRCEFLKELPKDYLGFKIRDAIIAESIFRNASDIIETATLDERAIIIE